MNNNLHPLSTELLDILTDSKPAGALQWDRRVEEAVADFENILRRTRQFGRISIKLEKNFGTSAEVSLIDIRTLDGVLTFKLEFNAPATLRDTTDFLTQIKTMNQALELGALLESTLYHRKV